MTKRDWLKKARRHEARARREEKRAARFPEGHPVRKAAEQAARIDRTLAADARTMART